ncbi:MFS transporter [Stappia indica]|uniref:MFS transporter n=1 Tax=Stappia indica TaxID=538381 RepID=UPI001CD50004|nr:MFS transporter [Stappia indica]MCA1298592.1 MFS transporter [Stappia indica]
MSTDHAATAPGTYRLATDSIYLRSWACVLLSMSGTFLLLLSISALVYEQTGSAFLSSAVFGTQWLLAIASPPAVGWLTSRFKIIDILVWNDVAAAGLVVLVALALQWSVWLCLGLLAVHGFLEATNKSLRILPLKAHVPPTSIKQAISYFATSQYLASSFGAILGLLMINRISILEIAYLDALTFLASALLYRSLKSVRIDVPKGAQRRREVVALAKTDPVLLRAACYLVLSTAVFQGYHNVARTEFAFQYLNLDHDGTMYIQIVSSIGIMVGAVAAGRLQGFMNAYRSALPLVAAVGMLCIGTFLPLGPVGRLAMYGLFIMTFEVAFVVFQADMVARTPIELLPTVNAYSLAGMTSGMMLVVYLGAWATDMTSLLAVASALAIVAVFVSLAVNLRTNPERPA